MFFANHTRRVLVFVIEEIFSIRNVDILYISVHTILNVALLLVKGWDLVVLMCVVIVRMRLFIILFTCKDISMNRFDIHDFFLRV